MSGRGFVLLLAVLAVGGCAVRQPGGRSDVWTTGSYVEGGYVYHGIGIRF